MGSVLYFTGLRAPGFCEVPDDSLRLGAFGARAGDVCRFRPGLYVPGRPHVCATLASPRRVRIGYCQRDERGTLLSFANPQFQSELYPPGTLRVCGKVQWFYRRQPAAGWAPVAPTTAVVLNGPAPVVTWRTNAAGADEWVSPNVIIATGIMVQEWAGGGWFKQIHPEDQPNTLAVWWRAICTGEPFSSAQRLLCHGVYRWSVVMGNPIRDAAGRVTEWRGILQVCEASDELADEQMTA